MEQCHVQSQRHPEPIAIFQPELVLNRTGTKAGSAVFFNCVCVCVSLTFSGKVYKINDSIRKGYYCNQTMWKTMHLHLCACAHTHRSVAVSIGFAAPLVLSIKKRNWPPNPYTHLADSTYLQPRNSQCIQNQVSTDMMREMGKLNKNQVPKLTTSALG